VGGDGESWEGNVRGDMVRVGRGERWEGNVRGGRGR